MKCRRCNVDMLPGKAFIPTVVSYPDFDGDKPEDGVTQSPGPGKLVECRKCPKCGRSVSK